VLNTAVAEALRQFADILEASDNFTAELARLVKKTFAKHKRIVFNGNNYTEEWSAEAMRRGLSNLKTTVDALPEFTSSKSKELFTTHKVFTPSEIRSRFEILMENYCKTIRIEALTMLDMVKREIIPACVDYQNDLAGLLGKKKLYSEYDASLEGHLLGEISSLSSSLLQKLNALEQALSEPAGKQDIAGQARFTRDRVFAAMSELRLTADKLETLAAKKYWPFPTYGKLLYSVM
jgi:glutamine synthetase